ncbi:MAG TPA: hypothetical protein DCZ51_04680, partial [Bacteroidales bacterium]|nr:hypothetical protein [Bacteroidales bacterium]
MILSGYNKFIFSIFAENHDSLIIKVFALKIGKGYLSFLQIQYTKVDSSGRPMPSFIFNTRIKVIDSSSRDIIFSKGKIIIKDDSVKIEFATELIMIYLNYSLFRAETSPLKVLSADNKEKDSLTWKSYNFRSLVKGNLITPNTSAEFINAAGNIDLLRSKRIPSDVKGLLWSRLQNKDIDLAFSFIFNKDRKNDSRMYLRYEKNLLEFSEIEYSAGKDRISPRLFIKYPDSVRLLATNESHRISINIYDQAEAGTGELVNSFDLIGKLFNGFLRRLTGNPNGLRLLAFADVTINNNLTSTEFKGIT